jgi:vacuolar protein sorting-associated protein 72
MTKLLEDEDSADEEFWNQDAFAEDEEDEKYVSERSRGDQGTKKAGAESP